VINGVGVVTVLGGSLMPPEVVQAMEEASRYFVSVPELQKQVRKRGHPRAYTGWYDFSASSLKSNTCRLPPAQNHRPYRVFCKTSENFPRQCG